ncbi:hypothetical protein DFH06DRAFT_1128095 [Mycena polygramma]|nr:hypothetical protein DFH06DRAFT_1128095 [Mycena polygramma]
MPFYSNPTDDVTIIIIGIHNASAIPWSSTRTFPAELKRQWCFSEIQNFFEMSFLQKPRRPASQLRLDQWHPRHAPRTQRERAKRMPVNQDGSGRAKEKRIGEGRRHDWDSSAFSGKRRTDILEVVGRGVLHWGYVQATLRQQLTARAAVIFAAIFKRRVSARIFYLAKLLNRGTDPRPAKAYLTALVPSFGLALRP